MTIKRPRTPVTRRRFLQGSTAVAAGITLLPKSGWSASDPIVNFYNWDTYIGETTLDDFKTASGIEAKMDLFADNDELFAKLKAGNPGYDLIVPTNDYVERMIVAGMLVPLDHSKIPNIKNIDPVFMDPAFDPGRKYSLPYMWGTIGIGYRKSRVDGVPDSWKWLYDSDKYTGRIAMLGQASDVIGMGLKYMGKSLNTRDAGEIKAAERMLIAQKPHIKVFADDNGQDLLLSGEVDLTMEWNGDIGFVVPAEGGLLWEDGLAIPTDAPHPENAHKLIDFILDAEAGAAIADFIQYATPNAAAKALMSADYTENPAIFPPADVIGRCETAIYLGEDVTRLYDESWTRILAA